MGLLEKIFPVANNAPQIVNATSFESLTAYKPSFTSWNGSIYEQLAVRSAIDARARHISKLKVEINGAARPKLQTKLKKRPNDWQTWSKFLYRASTILDVQGTVCIVPVVDIYGDTTGFFPVLPSRCELRELNGKLWLRYEFRNGQIAAAEFSRCAVLTKFQYQDDFFGSDNTPLAETMEVIHMQAQGIQEAVRNGATYRFMAQLSNFSTPEDLAKERKAFSRENLQNDAEAGGLLLFPNTYKDIRQFDNKPFTVDAEQMALINTNIYNYFGVNEHILQNKAYGNEWAAFYEGCVEVFALQFSEAMTQALFNDREQSEGALLMATANRLQYLSSADKLSVSAQMADRGIMSINEIRDIWNLPPVEGGDVRMIRGEYYDTDEKTNNKEASASNDD